MGEYPLCTFVMLSSLPSLCFISSMLQNDLNKKESKFVVTIKHLLSLEKESLGFKSQQRVLLTVDK